MISADQFHHCDVRMRQAKQNPEHQFGGLALNICGGFLNKQIYKIWRSIEKVVCLDINVRAPDALGRLQEEMRSGKISDEMWDLYMSRVLTESDERLLQSPFADRPVRYVVQRHKIRVMRSLKQAEDQSRELKTPLYVIQCQDVAVHAEDAQKLTDEVRGDLLRRVDPEHTKGLPSFLPLYRGMRLLLSSKDCVRLGVMKGCPSYATSSSRRMKYCHLTLSPVTHTI